MNPSTNPGVTRSLWRCLRADLRRVVSQMRKEDGQPSVLSHGLQPLHHITFSTQLRCVTHVAERHCLVSVDIDGNVRLHHEDGHVWSQAQMPWPISGLLYAAGVEVYVAWNPQGLLLLDTSLSVVSVSPVKEELHCCVYDPGRKQILSAGVGGISIWKISLSGRSLVWTRTLSQSMKTTDKIHVIALDKESDNPQTCVAACGTSVWEFHLRDENLLRLRKNLHYRTITSLVYSEGLRLLISGSRDHTIKIWGAEGQLVVVFVGHTGAVTSLALHSSSMTIGSASEDQTLRFWDVNAREQTDELEVSGCPSGIEIFGNGGERVLSYTRSDLHIWQIKKLYQIHSYVGSDVMELRVLRGPDPPRALCVCSDGTVRLISALSGAHLSSLTLQRDERPLGAEYCPHQETVCVLLEDGNLLKANATDNPMRVWSKRRVGSERGAPRCFVLYSQESADLKHRFFLVIGSDDGDLCVCDWFSCSLLFQTKAHGPGHVTSLTCDPKNNFVISAGSDGTVKVWRFFAHAEESLSLCLSFFCSQPVGRMCSFKCQLFVAFHDPSSASYSLVQYCLKSETRKDHPPGNDHRDQITGLCCCPALHLLATCGRDGRIRVWNDQNQLIRTLCLNSTPESLAFIGNSGDLLVGMGRRLFRVHLAKLLPKSYQVKILCMAASSSVTDPPGPQTPLHTDDETALAYTRNVFCTEEGGTWKDGEREEEYKALSCRDRELFLLREGQLKPRKKPNSNKQTRREAMERYMHRVYQQRPRVMIPGDDDGAADEPPVAKTAEDVPNTPGANNRGFFSDKALPGRRQASILSTGFVPNSALLQLLWPTECLELNHPPGIHHQKWTDKFIFRHSPSMEEEVGVSMMEEVGVSMMEEVGVSMREEVGVSVMEEVGVSMREEVGTVENEAEEMMDEAEEVPLILQKIMEASAPEPDPLPDPSPPTLAVQRHEERKITVLPQRPLISRIPRPRPPATKGPGWHSDVPDPRTVPAHTQTVTPTTDSAQPDPQEPKTPHVKISSLPPEEEEATEEIPPFITQFQHTSWFCKVFRDIQAEHVEFEARLLRVLIHMEPPIQMELLRALHVLYQQGHLKDLRYTFHTLMEVVDSRRGINMKNSDDLDFLFHCLHFLIQMSGSRRELVLELLLTCVQIHPLHRKRFLDLFKDIGVEDTHDFIGRQVTTWDNWEYTQEDRAMLKRTCEDWLDSWTAQLVDYLHAAMTPDTKPQRSVRHGGAAPRSQRHLPAEPFNVTPSDVLNYFCEIQMRAEIQAMRAADVADESTVLALPPVHRTRALLRLGETGLNLRHKNQKGVTLPPIPQRSRVINYINLPVKKISINPFPPTKGATRLSGSLAQEAHQYFILQQSYLESF